MKVVFFGTPEFAVPIAQSLLEKHQIQAVVTQPDRPRGRLLKAQPSPVKIWALNHNLTVWQPENLNQEQFKSAVQKLELEVIVVAAYGRILPQWLLKLPKYGCLNIHASLLPKYRGAAPIQRAILNGEQLTGITIMQMDPGLDTGPMLMQKATLIGQKDAGKLTAELSQLGAYLINKTLTKLEKGDIVPVKQNDSLATFAPPIKKEELKISWQKPAAAVERIIQAFAPQPGAFCFFNNLRLKIFAAQTSAVTKPGNPGELFVNQQRLFVLCQPGVLEIKTVQPAGRKVMTAAEFIRGYKPVSGSFFT